MKKLILIPLLILSIAIQAQIIDFPKITINDSDQILGLHDLKINVEITGSIATTTLEMNFYNDANRVMEGELVFPLGEGQSVSRFAMDVNGRLREGVVVEKDKGQKVFESIVRRGVDPGLLEITKGNNFRSRVYPIPPKGYKRIVVAYEQELKSSEDGYVYMLPLNFNDRIKNFEMRVEVFNQKVKPVLAKTSYNNVVFNKWKTSYTAEVKETNFAPNKQFNFLVPFNPQKESILIDKGVVSNVNYFYIHLLPEISKRIKQKPNSICILWDVSGSSENRKIQEEIEFVGKYLNYIGNLRVKLVTFNVEIESVREYDIIKGNWEALKKDLVNLTYDGATQLGCLDLKKNPADEMLLFSDGVNTIGKKEVRLSSTPVYTINSNVTAEHGYLKWLALNTGGDYINLASASVAEAVERISYQTFQFISADFDKAKISEVYPSVFTPIMHDFSLSGKLYSNEASITLNFGYGKEIVYSKEVVLKKTDEVATNGLIERVWAQKKLAELTIDNKNNKAEITLIGKRHSIVTEGTSLIVLDNISDYVEHEIIPPAELRDQYFAILANKRKQQDERVAARLERVVQLWNEKMDWWQKSFEKVKVETKLNDQRVVAPPPTDIPPRNYSRNTKQISGRVRDAVDNEAIIGANVIVKGSSTGTITDLQGRFRLTIPENAVLSISFIGYLTEEIDMINKNQVDIKLVHDVRQLSEVVVIGYGVSRRQDVVGSVAAVQEPRRSERRETQSAQQMVYGINASGSLDINDVASTGHSRRTVYSNIELKMWEPDMPYLNVLNSTEAKHLYKKYLTLKPDYQSTPAFFIDVADIFIRNNDLKTATKILSNLAEMKLQDHELLRALARKLQQMQVMDLAISIFEEVKELRPEEPQSFRDLGLALADNGQYQKSIEALYHVVLNKWDNRFSGIEPIIVGELNAIIVKAGRKAVVSHIDQRLIAHLPVDIRVVVDWDSDNTDIDLWVTDPMGVKCYYGQNRTINGGYISQDLTGGYGPEEFWIKKAVNGKYFVQIDYYGSSRQRISGPVIVQVKLFTNYGRPSQEVKEVTLRLTENKEVIDVGDLVFGKK
jgi:uncharacterized protein YfaP (DUF2135 family)